MWGGYHLYEMKGLPYDGNSCIAAESWEISGHKKYPSRVMMPNGSIFTFMDLLKNRRLAGLILGEAVIEHFGQDFPILVKFVDVHKHMSAHLHPSAAAAKALGEADPGKEFVDSIMAEMALKGASKKRLIKKLAEQFNFDKQKVLFRLKRALITERYAAAHAE